MSMTPIASPALDSPGGASAGGFAALNERRAAADSNEEFRQVFQRFVGTTFYGEMLQSMRKTLGKPAYFHGGRAEEVFQKQLDTELAEHLSSATAEVFSDPMFELMQLPRG